MDQSSSTLRALSSAEASLENWGSSRRPKAWDCRENCLETAVLTGRREGVPWHGWHLQDPPDSAAHGPDVAVSLCIPAAESAGQEGDEASRSGDAQGPGGSVALWPTWN